MHCVAGAGDDGEARAPAAHLAGELHRQHRIVHRQDQRRRVAEVQPVDQLGAGDVAEDDRLAFAAARGDRVDVGIDRHIRPAMGLEHLGDQAADAAEADDDRGGRLGAGPDFRDLDVGRHVDAPRRDLAELAEQGRQGQAQRRDDLPEGRGRPADQLGRRRRPEHDQRRLRRRGHQHGDFGRHALARARQDQEGRGHRRFDQHDADHADQDELPIGRDHAQIDAHADGDQEDAQREAAEGAVITSTRRDNRSRR
jgi:hypothetical protein